MKVGKRMLFLMKMVKFSTSIIGVLTERGRGGAQTTEKTNTQTVLCLNVLFFFSRTKSAHKVVFAHYSVSRLRFLPMDTIQFKSTVVW